MVAALAVGGLVRYGARMNKVLSVVLATCALHLAPVGLSPARAEPAAGVLDEAPAVPTIKDKAARKKLVAKHGLSLQWVESKPKGTVNIWDDGGFLRIEGEQREPATGNFVKVEGWLTRVEAKQFKMRGRIVTQTTHIYGGKECAREGDFTFLIKGGRKFWRLQEMTNGCDGSGVVDYVDITIAPVK